MRVDRYKCFPLEKQSSVNWLGPLNNICPLLIQHSSCLPVFGAVKEITLTISLLCQCLRERKKWMSDQWLMILSECRRITWLAICNTPKCIKQMISKAYLTRWRNKGRIIYFFREIILTRVTWLGYIRMFVSYFIIFRNFKHLFMMIFDK